VRERIQEDLAVAHQAPKEVSLHIRWRFLVLSLSLGTCLVGGFAPWSPPEARTAGFAIASAIVAAMAKPIQGMDP
jgi:hypothetical protein